jgi:hypothetical protein
MPSSIAKVAVLYIVHKFVHEDDNILKLAEACGYTVDDRQKEIASTFKHFKKHSSELHVTI